MIHIPGKIPISISPYFWVLAVAIGWLNSQNIIATLVWMLVIIISVLFHEFGHALTGLLFKQQSRIELVIFGGVTYRTGPKLKLWQEFIVVLNGPLFGFMLCFISYFLIFHFSSERQPVLKYAAEVSTAVNFIWSILNLLPVIPLDGGKLMSILFEGLLGVRGLKAAMLFSTFLGVLLGLFCFMYHAVIVGALFFFLAFEGYRGWLASRGLTESDKDETVQKLLEQAELNYQTGNKSVARSQLLEIRKKSEKGLLYTEATVLLSSILSQEGNDLEAFEILSPLKEVLEAEDLLLLQKIAYSTGHYEEAISIGTSSYQIIPNFDTALINALSSARLDQVMPALGWLQCAARDGLDDLKEVIKRPDFDKIRDDPQFKQFALQYE